MKDHLRDYATSALRYYARLGCPSYDAMRRQLYDRMLTEHERERAISSGIGDPTPQAVINAENAMLELRGSLEDILAAEKTMASLKFPEVRKAIELVYFANADQPLAKGDIHARVTKASMDIPAGMATIYRWLKKARMIFAEERGLRLEP